jgi:hypothetical protein
MEGIDSEIAFCDAELERIAKQKRLLTVDLDLEAGQIFKKKAELKIAKEEAFYRLHPTLFVIHGHASPRNNGSYARYSSFDQVMACFTTREAAVAALGDRARASGSHHDIYYSIRVEATVNVPKDALAKLNNPHYRGLDWSP